MVLEGATSNDSFPSADSLPPSDLPSSDFDPYDPSSGGDNASTITRQGPNIRISQHGEDGNAIGQPIYINLNDYPQMINMFPRGTSEPPRIIVEGIKSQAHFMAKTLQRPITQDEANSLAFHFTKTLRIASYGAPVGIAVSMLLAYRGMKTYRFPFGMINPTKEGGRFSKDVFWPFYSKWAIRSAWHISRFGTYAILGTIFGQIFFSSYALSVASAGRAMDPRMKDFNETLRQKSRSGLGREAADVRRGEEEEVPGARQMETYDMARQRRNIQGFGRRDRQSTDDASPTGGAFSDEFANDSQQPGFMSEQEVQQHADARMASSSDRSSPSETASRAQRSDEGSSQASRASREGQSKSSGSAWDRLRQDAMSGQSSSRGTTPSDSAGARSSGRGRENSSIGDSFTFSSDDEDGQLAKSEAQKDFDQRIARERKGRDFNEEGRRWR